jgi:hypothetical protein
VVHGREDVLALQIRVGLEDFLLVPAARQLAQDALDRDPRPAGTRVLRS